MIINKNYPLVDSNILIDYFGHFRSIDEFVNIFSHPVYINNTILTESVNFIQNKISLTASGDMVDDILGYPENFGFLSIDWIVCEHAMEIFRIYRSSKIGFCDCLILAQAEYYDLTLLSKDTRLQMYTNVRVINPFAD